MAWKYLMAGLLFRVRFPRPGGFSSCDFRPHFDGHLHNAFRAILPLSTVADTRQLAIDHYRAIVLWLRRIRWLFAAGDRIQVIVGLSTTARYPARQILKGWIPANRLAAVRPDFQLADAERLGGGVGELEGWEHGVFPESTSTFNQQSSFRARP